jgi:hypothetical protein
MDRSNIAIATLSVLLLALFGAAVTSQSWVPLLMEPDIAAAMIVVGGFFLIHVALTLGLIWATVVAAVQWHRNIGHRTMLNRAFLAVGTTAAMVASAYAVFFMVG